MTVHSLPHFVIPIQTKLNMQHKYSTIKLCNVNNMQACTSIQLRYTQLSVICNQYYVWGCIKYLLAVLATPSTYNSEIARNPKSSLSYYNISYLPVKVPSNSV